MAARLEAKFTVPASVRRTLAELEAPQLNETLETFLRKAAFKVQTNVTSDQIIRGGKQAPHPTRVTSRTGELRRSYGVDASTRAKATDTSRLPNAISLGSDLVYSAVHEFGLGPYPVRAHFKPGFEEEAAGFEDLLLAEWRKAVHDA